MILRTNLLAHPETTVTDFEFSVQIGKCVSLPDISEAIIAPIHLDAGQAHMIDISEELQRVKETITCGHEFTFTPKLIKHNNAIPFKRGKIRNVPELTYREEAQTLVLDATNIGEGKSYAMVVEITKGQDNNEEFEANTGLKFSINVGSQCENLSYELQAREIPYTIPISQSPSGPEVKEVQLLTTDKPYCHQQCSLYRADGSYVEETSFIKHFNSLTGVLSVSKESLDDGVITETITIKCGSFESEFSIKAVDECE